MQRTTRRLFAELDRRVAVSPLCWNKLGHFYHHLGSRESKLLRTPFHDYERAVALPELRGEKFPAELHRMLRRKRFDPATEITAEDVFLVPDHFGDSRRLRLPELIRKINIRSIAIFHDAAVERLALHGKKTIAKFREYLTALAAFDRVVCISEQSRNDLMAFWKQAGIRNIPETFVEGWPLEFDEAERRARSTSPVVRRSDPKPVILCVSTFGPRKNHLPLLNAAELLWSNGANFELQLVGAWAGNFTVSKKIRTLKSKGRPLAWLKHVDDKTLHALYRQSAFTVYPSLMEGFGLPILESLWHGKPCICGGNGALGEVARGGGCLIVDQTKTSALAEGIRSLLEDRPLYSRLSVEAEARQFRTWADYTDKFLNYLRAEGVIRAAGSN